MINISFADLTHTGQSISANTIPCGVSMVAAYAKKQFGNKINNELFRYPEDFNTYLKKNNPQIVCFSALSWNMELSHAFAKHIKLNSKNVITVFGGSNFPITDDAQKQFLKERYPYIDFFIEGEGELAFVELLNNLENFDFNYTKLKEKHTIVPNVRYVYEDSFVTSDKLPRIKDLDIIPSIYLDGMSDKFFDDYLSPTIQTARGCPYTCTFCAIASSHWTKVRRFSMDRIKAEINYIGKRAKVPELLIADDNFGIFKEDIETAKIIAKTQKKYNYPNYINQATAKNNKDRIIEISKILKGRFNPTAAVQSTDSEVLDIIKRKNLPLKELSKIVRDFSTGQNSFTEIILALPGDTKEKHFKSNLDLIDEGFSIIRNHQFMLLEGTQSETKESREKYNIKSLFHIQPRCFGFYEVYDKKIYTGEIEENCVSTDTMTYEDYLECRSFNLTIEIFINDAIFYDLMQYLIQKNISPSQFIKNIHIEATQINPTIKKLYVDYKTEEKNNFWSNRKDLENFFKKTDTIKRYISGELGTNEIYKYRSIAVFYNMGELHKIAYKAARSLLSKSGSFSEIEKRYLDELYEFSLMRKKECFNLNLAISKKFHFDFIHLLKNNFRINPLNSFSKVKHEIRTSHSDWQKGNIKSLVKQYGDSLQGTLRIVSRSQPSTFYRSAIKV